MGIIYDMNQGNNQEVKKDVDYNRIYSEEGINTVFTMFGAESISDAMIPTSQQFKCWVNGVETKQYVVDSVNHYEFYEVIVNRIVNEKMDYDAARNYVKQVKKGLRTIQGAWSRSYGGLRGELIRRMSEIKRPLTIHKMVDKQQRVPFELVMYWVFERKVGHDCVDDCEYGCCGDKRLMALVKEKDREYKEEIERC